MHSRHRQADPKAYMDTKNKHTNKKDSQNKYEKKKNKCGGITLPTFRTFQQMCGKNWMSI